ncbi:MAG: YeeE/YedE family protein, partial [Pseudomonadota bacterium]|nr:YeeE/YedE family protein [Pseudomonadota bacterium]
AGWYFTYALSTQVFEPIQAESLSFVRPLATTGEIALGGDTIVGLDQGVLIGIVAGALVAALLFREFRIGTFSEPGTPSIYRYALGSAMMGFGGILAVGCTIGAGFTGGSVLAVSSLVGLLAMISGAAIADLVVDGGGARSVRSPTLPAK